MSMGSAIALNGTPSWGRWRGSNRSRSRRTARARALGRRRLGLGFRRRRRVGRTREWETEWAREQTERWGHGRMALSASGQGQKHSYRKANSTHTTASGPKQLEDVKMAKLSETLNCNGKSQNSWILMVHLKVLRIVMVPIQITLTKEQAVVKQYPYWYFCKKVSKCFQLSRMGTQLHIYDASSDLELLQNPTCLCHRYRNA